MDDDRGNYGLSISEEDVQLIEHGVVTTKYFDVDQEDGVVHMNIEHTCHGAITLGGIEEFRLSPEEVDDLIEALQGVRDDAWEYVSDHRMRLAAASQEDTDGQKQAEGETSAAQT